MVLVVLAIPVAIGIQYLSQQDNKSKRPNLVSQGQTDARGHSLTTADAMDIRESDPVSQEKAEGEQNAETKSHVPLEGFRGIPWGSSIEQVKTIYPDTQWIAGISADTKVPDSDTNGYLQREETIANIHCITRFIFVDGKFMGASVSRRKRDQVDANHSLSEYSILKDLLTRKYGKPKYDGPSWLSEQAETRYQLSIMNRSLGEDKSNDDLGARALAAGDVTLHARWETATDLLTMECGQVWDMKGDVPLFVSWRIDYAPKAATPSGGPKYSEQDALDDL